MGRMWHHDSQGGEAVSPRRPVPPLPPLPLCPLPARFPPVWGPLPWDPFSLLSPQPTHSAPLAPDERVLTNPFKRGHQTPLLPRNQAALRRPQRGQVGAGQGAGWTPRVKTYGFMPHGSHVLGPQMMARELQQM